MKKLVIISASFLCLTACSFMSHETVYENKIPNDMRIELDVGWFDKEKGLIEVVNNDVYINTYKKDSYDYSYFAHLNNGNYEYYRKDVLHEEDWEIFTPATPNFENMTTLDAINSFVGAISSLYSDIFCINVINGVKSSGTAKVLDIDTSIYNVESKTYWYFDGINMFLKIYDESEKEWSCEVTNYQYYKHFTDAPNFDK